MQRKRLSLILAVALIGSLLGFVPSVAQAQTNPLPVRNAGILMPLEATEDKDQISDGFDGVDSLAHFTAITDPRADRVEFFVCSDATTTGAGIGTNACRSIGTDTSGTQPVGPTGSNETFDLGSFEAYEVFYDIPADLDDENVTVVIRACNGAPSGDVQGGTAVEQETTPVNCNDHAEEDIALDDASSDSGVAIPLGGEGQELPSGEITGICTGTEAECLPVGSTGSGSVAGTGTGTYSAFPHGSVLPTTAFSLRFRTSDDVEEAGACIATITTDSDDDTDPAPNNCSLFATDTEKTDRNSSGADNQTTYNEYTARFNGVTTDEDYDVAIFGDGNDSLNTNNAECAGGDFVVAGALTNSFGPVANTNLCVLDEHYAVGIAQTTSGLALTFNEDDTAPIGEGTTTCGAPDTAETNRLGTTERVTACLTDQNGNVINGTITFESTGVGTLFCNNVQATPTTGTEGDTQRCTVTTTDGEADAELRNTDATTPTAGGRAGSPGDQTVIACVDRTATTSNPVGCGTSDTPTSNEVVKTWLTIPEEVTLVFAEEDGSADCVNGDSFKVNAVGDNDTLVACVTDEQGRTASTAGSDSDAAANSYRLAFDTNSCNAVGFTSNPPSETDADGQAEVQIRAIAQGTCTIDVELRNAAGTQLDTASVTKSVEGTQGQNPQCNDGVDNDGDGNIDFPDDAGCASIDDDTENSEGTPGPIVESGPCTGYGEGTRTNLNTGGQIIVGTEGNDILDGTDGNDIICGLGGNDIISAGDGSDQVVGNAGEDIISGGAGKDTINGNRDDDTIDGKGGNDIIKGSKGDDTLRGNGGFDTIRGGGGNDTLQGGKGQDILRGGGGNDTLKGFTGNDILNGGPGTDTCNPGPGRDKVRNCER